MFKKLFIITIISLNLGLGVTQLWLSSTRASDGQTLASIQKETDELALASWRLRETIYEKSALTYIYAQVNGSDLSSVKPQFMSASQPLAISLSTP